MGDPNIQPYLTSEDGVLFDLRISHGDVSFDMWELEENEVLHFIEDIKSMLYLLKHGAGNLKERNEASMDKTGGTW